MRFSRAAPLGFVMLVVIALLNAGESPSLERTAAEVTPRGAAPTALRAGFTDLPPPPPPLVAARALVRRQCRDFSRTSSSRRGAGAPATKTRCRRRARGGADVLLHRPVVRDAAHGEGAVVGGPHVPAEHRLEGRARPRHRRARRLRRDRARVHHAQVLRPDAESRPVPVARAAGERRRPLGRAGAGRDGGARAPHGQPLAAGATRATRRGDIWSLTPDRTHLSHRPSHTHR